VDAVDAGDVDAGGEQVDVEEDAAQRVAEAPDAALALLVGQLVVHVRGEERGEPRGALDTAGGGVPLAPQLEQGAEDAQAAVCIFVGRARKDDRLFDRRRADAERAALGLGVHQVQQLRHRPELVRRPAHVGRADATEVVVELGRVLHAHVRAVGAVGAAVARRRVGHAHPALHLRPQHRVVVVGRHGQRVAPQVGKARGREAAGGEALGKAKGVDDGADQVALGVERGAVVRGEAAGRAAARAEPRRAGKLATLVPLKQQAQYVVLFQVGAARAGRHVAHRLKLAAARV
jgi:hypothetical protein